MPAEQPPSLSQIIGTNNPDVLCVVPDWRIQRLPITQREIFFRRAQQIFTLPNQNRVARYIFYNDMDSLRPDERTHVAHESLSFAILGIDEANENPPSHKNVHQIERRFPDSPMLIKGEVFSRPNAPFSADFITARTFEHQEHGEHARTYMGVTGDGSTMMMSQEYLQTVVPDMVEICSFTHEGKRHFRPDIFWRVALGAILGDTSMPTPQEFLENPKLQSAFDYARKTQSIQPFITSRNQLNLKKLLTNQINEHLWNFMRLAFPKNKANIGFTKETFHRYPSGVLAVMVYREDQQVRQANANGFAVTGDVGVGVSNPHRSTLGLVHGNDVNIVQNHDDVRILAGLDMNTDPAKDFIARYRVSFTGNFPQPPDFLNLMLTQNFSRATPLVEGPLWNPNGPKRAVTYTDGLPLKGENMIAQGAGIHSMEVGGRDWIASLLLKDPYLAVLDSVYNRLVERDLRRPDDMAYLIFADQNDLPHPEDLFTPIFQE